MMMLVVLCQVQSITPTSLPCIPSFFLVSFSFSPAKHLGTTQAQTIGNQEHIVGSCMPNTSGDNSSVGQLIIINLVLQFGLMVPLRGAFWLA
jgi:hypothetical protein